MAASSVMDPPDVGAPVGAVVALKPTEQAKSRLHLAAPLRRRIAWAMAVDTLTALAAAVDQVLVVSDQPSVAARLRRLGLSVIVVGEPLRSGMNAALTSGGRELAGRGCGSVVASVGDLPALRAESVRRVLAASRPHPRSFLADASGGGTTMLIAHGCDLQPRFQGRSAAAHRSGGAIALDAGRLGGPVADARRDVDTEVDLNDAYRLGLGAATAALFDPATGTLGRYDAITAVNPAAAGSCAAITSAGYRVRLPRFAIQDSLREVHTGQRLHAVLARDHVLAAWL